MAFQICQEEVETHEWSVCCCNPKLHKWEWGTIQGQCCQIFVYQNIKKTSGYYKQFSGDKFTSDKWLLSNSSAFQSIQIKNKPKK